MRRQDGSLGCRKAHDRDGIDGWADDVTGEIDVREEGRVWLADGKRRGEMKGLGSKC